MNWRDPLVAKLRWKTQLSPQLYFCGFTIHNSLLSILALSQPDSGRPWLECFKQVESVADPRAGNLGAWAFCAERSPAG